MSKLIKSEFSTRPKSHARSWGSILAACALMLSACAGGGASSSDGAGSSNSEDGGAISLAGETLRFVVPSAPGGSFDRIARAVELGFEEASGATVVVENEPGAGGLLATNRTFAASREEPRLQLVITVGAVASQLAEGVAEGVNYDLAEFEWIGSFSNEPEVLVTAANSRFAEPGALKAAIDAGETLRFGSTGPGDNMWINALLLREVLGAQVELIGAFEGSPEVYAGLLRGDIDFAMSALSSALIPIEAGDGVPLLYLGEDMARFPKINSMLQEVPTFQEFALEAGVGSEDLKFLDPYTDIVQISRTLVAPPGTDSARVAAYREAFDAAVGDDELVGQLAEQGIYFIPTPGQNVERLIVSALDASPEFVALMKEAFRGA